MVEIDVPKRNEKERDGFIDKMYVAETKWIRGSISELDLDAPRKHPQTLATHNSSRRRQDPKKSHIRRSIA
jgi:hypothetical protein